MADEKKRAVDDDKPKATGGRTLVMCFDGTANQFDETNTNIVHIFSLLDKEDPHQLVYYQTGVGTYVGPSVTTPIGKYISKWADVAMAWYLDAHVIDGYKFLQSNYQKGDRICMFGFSRGAYTARALIGLLPKSMPEQVEFAYRIFKSGKATATYKRSFCRPVRIEFLGVFDTVSSVGAMVPRVLPFSIDNHITKTFRHALSLDEHRAKFRSNTWHLVHPDLHLDSDGNWTGRGSKGGNLSFFDRWAVRKGQKSVEAEIEEEEKETAEADGEVVKHYVTDVKEVWFAGSHCDVGGGNALDTEPYKLSNIALRWMLREVIHADTGIVWNRRKMMRFGVPGTEFAPQTTRIPVSPSVNKSMFKNAKKAAMAQASLKTQGSAQPQQPTLLTDARHRSDDDAKANEKAANGNGLSKRKDSTAAETMVGDDDGGRAGENDESGQELESIEVPWWYRDAIEPIRDELNHQPGWWLLELLPFYIKRQDEHSHWKKYLRVNAFRPRVIPAPPHPENPNHPDHDHEHGANLPADTLVHISVKTRMEAPEAYERSWRSLWLKKNRPYTPRAWPKHGDPVFVE
ncbi:hypothetical protein DL93DRAFT_2162355 [Clavulina sp. PMI_390]|nr:hypothetical protein DL93DRAFT_2162355 [Clavulina sp. PMI_390]